MIISFGNEKHQQYTLSEDLIASSARFRHLSVLPVNIYNGPAEDYDAFKILLGWLNLYKIHYGKLVFLPKYLYLPPSCDSSQKY